MVVHAFNGRTMDIQIELDDEDDGAGAGGSNNKKKENLQQTVLNMATHDFLAMSSNAEVKDASRIALEKYGCGSCGPRGFYGTIDVHLQLEQAIAEFTGTQGAIMYSDGASTVTSTIAAFAKRGDLLVVDDGVYEPIVTGVTLSRANIEWFRHNDMVRNGASMDTPLKMVSILTLKMSTHGTIGGPPSRTGKGEENGQAFPSKAKRPTSFHCRGRSLQELRNHCSL
jgi:Aminotransferase class I and II